MSQWPGARSGKTRRAALACVGCACREPGTISRQVDLSTRSPGMTYEVKLESFEGPIDLLLHLIARQRVDIYEVSLKTITRDFIAAVAERNRLDLESTTGFLVVAATLLELKSARLLPRPDASPLDDCLVEERDVLLSRLVECATYRAAGAHLGRLLNAGTAFYPATPALGEVTTDLSPDPLADVSAREVAMAAARALRETPSPPLDTSHITPITASVREAFVEVAALLKGRGEATFAELSVHCSDRIEVIVNFLALLELFKAGVVEVLQAERFGDIRARWIGEGDVEVIAAEVEEYASRGGAVE